MSFVGGGSDLPPFYRRHGGAVVSTAIDKYIYVNINRKFDAGIRIAYSKTEEVSTVSEIEHPLVKATFEMMSIKGGVEIATIADIPSRGTGLGSSSAFTVGLIHGLSAYLGRHASAEELARRSCEVELIRCLQPIGKQDQYASAYGGMNLIVFRPDDEVVVTPIIMSPDARAKLQQSILVFYTGLTRSASAVLQDQNAGVTTDRKKSAALIEMVELAYAVRDELQAGNINTFAEILHENWRLKKSLSDQISTEAIDGWYADARRAGALGGKLLGAGAGGFLMFFAPQDRHDAIAQALPSLRRVPFGFDPLGSRIIFYDPTTSPDH